MEKDIKYYVQDFKKWIKQSSEGKRWHKERMERIKFFQEKLEKRKIDNLSEKDFSILIKNLWALNVWKNKDYVVQRLIKENGFEKIKKELKKLLYGTEDVEERWDNFRNSIKGLGPSSINEILAFSNPKKYALVNMKDYKVLPRLGIPINSVKDGKSYKEAIEQVKK